MAARRLTSCDPRPAHRQGTGRAASLPLHQLRSEALYALDRFRPGEGFTDPTTNAELDALVELAALGALQAARKATIDRAGDGLEPPAEAA